MGDVGCEGYGEVVELFGWNDVVDHVECLGVCCCDLIVGEE